MGDHVQAAGVRDLCEGLEVYLFGEGGYEQVRVDSHLSC